MLGIDLNESYPFAIMDIHCQLDGLEESGANAQVGMKRMYSQMFSASKRKYIIHVVALSDDIVKLIVNSTAAISMEEFETSIKEEIEKDIQCASKSFGVSISTNVDCTFKNLEELAAYKYALKIPIEIDDARQCSVEEHKKLMDAYKNLSKLINKNAFGGEVLTYMEHLFFLIFANYL